MSRIAVVLAAIVLASQPVFAEGEPVTSAAFQLPVLADSGERVLAGTASLVRSGETTAMLSTLDLRAGFGDGWVAELSVPAAIYADGETTQTFTGNVKIGVRQVRRQTSDRKLGFGFRLGLPTPPGPDAGIELVSTQLDRWTEFLPSTMSAGVFGDMLIERGRVYLQLHLALDVGSGPVPGTDGSSENLPLGSFRTSAALGVRATQRLAIVGEATTLTGFIPLDGTEEDAVFVGTRGGARYLFGSATAAAFLTMPVVSAAEERTLGAGFELSRAF